MSVIPRKKRVQKKFRGKSLTKQSHIKECDINEIMKRFERTGLVEHANTHQGDYGDFTFVPENYQEALQLVQNAQQMFLTVPAKVRQAFDNDPGRFLAFVQDPTNEDKMREMGLLPPVEPPKTEPPAPAPEEPEQPPASQ